MRSTPNRGTGRPNTGGVPARTDIALIELALEAVTIGERGRQTVKHFCGRRLGGTTIPQQRCGRIELGTRGIRGFGLM
jgi:hypothetical protein